MINRIQNKRFCLHYIYACTVYSYYVYINTHTYSINFENIYVYTHTRLFFGLRGLSIGVMVFILYNLYVLLPYT